MRLKFILFFFIIYIFYISLLISQNYKVIYDDKLTVRMNTQTEGIEIFKPLEDGYYILVDEDDSSIVRVKFQVKNNKLDGQEIRFTRHGKYLYLKKMWKDGRKNGKTIYYNEDGEKEKFYTFLNDTLHGPFYVNSHFETFSGFMKHGLRDSTWIIYYDKKYLNKDSSRMIREEIFYKNGRPFLINAFGKSGEILVKNGYGKTDNGMNVHKYENGLLKKEIWYDENRILSSIKHWSHPESIEGDRNLRIYNNIVSIINNKNYSGNYYRKLIRDGYWENRFSNGMIAYQGFYDNGEKIKNWKFYHPTGQIRSIAYFDLNRLDFYNLKGELISSNSLDSNYVEDLRSISSLSFPKNFEDYEQNISVPLQSLYNSDGGVSENFGLCDLMMYISFLKIQKNHNKTRIECCVRDGRSGELIPCSLVILDEKNKIIKETEYVSSGEFNFKFKFKPGIKIAANLIGYFSPVYSIGKFVAYELK